MRPRFDFSQERICLPASPTGDAKAHEPGPEQNNRGRFGNLRRQAGNAKSALASSFHLTMTE